MVMQAWCREREAERLSPLLQTQSIEPEVEVRRLHEPSEPSSQ